MRYLAVTRVAIIACIHALGAQRVNATVAFTKQWTIWLVQFFFFKCLLFNKAIRTMHFGWQTSCLVVTNSLKLKVVTRLFGTMFSNVCLLCSKYIFVVPVEHRSG